MGKRLTLILGGARSGKSDFAQSLASAHGGDDVIFAATAQALDDEMDARIQKHHRGRPANWKTLQAPRGLAEALQTALPVRVVVVDCVTLWASNVLLADEGAAPQAMERELNALLAWYRASGCELIVVSNEVGMGLVPDNVLGRGYRDLLGAANKLLAAAADQVFLVVAGLPLEIKARAVRVEDL